MRQARLNLVAAWATDAREQTDMLRSTVDPEKEVGSEPLWAYRKGGSPEKEVHPKRRFCTPDIWKICYYQKSISLEWHILTSSPLFERQHISLWFRVKNKNLNSNFQEFKMFKQCFYYFQHFSFQTSKYRNNIISSFNNSTTNVSSFQCSQNKHPTLSFSTLPNSKAQMFGMSTVSKFNLLDRTSF